MFKVLTKGCEPTRGTKYSACVDLYASEDVVIGAGETKLVGLGVKIDMEKLEERVNKFWGNHRNPHHFKHFLNSHYLQLMLRSSLGKKGLIAPHGIGIIDLDYRDEIKMVIHNPINLDFVEAISLQEVMVGFDGRSRKFPDTENAEFAIKKGDRIAQITLLEHKVYLFGINIDVERSGGFGSTSKGDK